MDGWMQYFINKYLHKNTFIYLFKFVINTYNIVNVILNISKNIFRILIYSFIQLGCNNIINQKLGYQQKELMPEELWTDLKELMPGHPQTFQNSFSFHLDW